MFERCTAALTSFSAFRFRLRDDEVSAVDERFREDRAVVELVGSAERGVEEGAEGIACELDAFLSVVHFDLAFPQVEQAP